MVKITYIVCTTIIELFLLSVMIWGPSYGWTFFAFMVLLGTMTGFTSRLNSWGDFGIA